MFREVLEKRSGFMPLQPKQGALSHEEDASGFRSNLAGLPTFRFGMSWCTDVRLFYHNILLHVCMTALVFQSSVLRRRVDLYSFLVDLFSQPKGLDKFTRLPGVGNVPRWVIGMEGPSPGASPSEEFVTRSLTALFFEFVTQERVSAFSDCFGLFEVRSSWVSFVLRYMIHSFSSTSSVHCIILDSLFSSFFGFQSSFFVLGSSCYVFHVSSLHSFLMFHSLLFIYYSSCFITSSACFMY